MIDVLLSAFREAVGPTAAMYCLAAMGLNVHFGYTGLLNFGQVGFMLVGAYGMAAAVAIFELPFLVGILIGLFLAAFLALILGVPTLRLRADYLAITTIAASEILRFVFQSSSMNDVTAGPFGIPSQFSNNQSFVATFRSWNPLPPGEYGFGTFNFSADKMWVMIVGWLVVALAAFLIYSLMRSPWGRVIKSIREDEDAARALGKNVFSFKMQALVLGGVLGGLAGMIFALDNAAVSAATFLPQVTFFAFAVMILGGAATVTGPVLGAIVFQFLLSFTDGSLRELDLMGSETIGASRLILVGAGIMALMVFRPQGILGSKREMMLDA